MKPQSSLTVVTALVLIGGLALSSAMPARAQEEVEVESLRPGRLGFGFNYLTEGDGAERHGWLRVCGVAPGSPAENASLAVDDVITEMDGEPFEETRHSDVLLRLARIEPGQTVAFTVRRGTTTRTISVTAGATTPEQLQRWRLNFQAAREVEAQNPH